MSDVNLQQALANLGASGRSSKLAYFALKLLGVELPTSVKRQGRILLPHGAVGLVVHESTLLGEDVRLYQGVTIGRSDVHLNEKFLRPGGGVVLERGVIVGAGAKILFQNGQDLVNGEDAVIGANAVVLQSVPAFEIWAGAPARKVGDRE